MTGTDEESEDPPEDGPISRWIDEDEIGEEFLQTLDKFATAGAFPTSDYLSQVSAEVDEAGTEALSELPEVGTDGEG